MNFLIININLGIFLEEIMLWLALLGSLVFLMYSLSSKVNCNWGQKLFLLLQEGWNKFTGRRIVKIIVPEPMGGNGGWCFDDGESDGVREITLAYDNCIHSICVWYDKNGELVNARKHGGDGGNEKAEIKLDFPDEFLRSVSGRYGKYGDHVVIRSLKFESNKRTFGPFGVDEGAPFSFTVDGGQIVGFKGRSGQYIDAIGFHISEVPKACKRLGSKL